MVRAKKEMNVSAAGKPTEKTAVPQAPVRTRHTVLDGIVEGVPRGVHTPVVDGILTGMELKASHSQHYKDKKSSFISAIPVAPSMTRDPLQVYGSIPYAVGKYGGK